MVIIDNLVQNTYSIEISSEGDYLLVGSSSSDTKNSSLDLIEIGDAMQLLMSLKLPLAESAGAGVESGCTIVRRISKKDYFVACNSNFVHLVMLVHNNLVLAFKIPHSHQDKRILDVVVHSNFIYTLAENDIKLGEILLL